jgi:hypothetical protein
LTVTRPPLLYLANDIPEPVTATVTSAPSKPMIQLAKAAGGRTLALSSTTSFKRTSQAIASNPWA